ncbi:hypothetical protein [Lewinella sp. W8]|uniref:hypothetical protein n=1 Tax=Lewinella sp. W8 TaxID=2528208 RepID=UPI0010685F09|nr:hypothetical protein [Lewinella sp. W8]MTB51959.1 hypothetical protein [Lewinella sp. W8]
MNKVLYLGMLLCCLSFSVRAQSNQEMMYQEKVATLDSTIENLYAVISGEKGVARNWELFKYLFHPDAKLIPTQKNEAGVYRPTFLTPDGYIERAGKWLVENGFFEKEIHRVENTFGNITQIFSTYESYRSEADDQPFARGINSIQLMDDGKRWWIINIYWTGETKDNPIPKEYLPE